MISSCRSPPWHPLLHSLLRLPPAVSPLQISQAILTKCNMNCAFPLLKPPMDLHACMLSSSIVSNSLQLRGLQPTRLLSPWDFPGKNTRVDCHFLLQGIFLTQGLNPHLLPWQVDSLPLSHWGTMHLITEKMRYSLCPLIKKSGKCYSTL